LREEVRKDHPNQERLSQAHSVNDQISFLVQVLPLFQLGMVSHHQMKDYGRDCIDSQGLVIVID